MSQWFLLDYRCRSCGSVSESLESRSAPAKTIAPPCGCAARADRVLSPIRIGTVWGYAAVRGKSDPPPTPEYLDTEPLADGVSYDDWKKKQRAQQRDKRRAQIKRELG